jgi:hypothetical protein
VAFVVSLTALLMALGESDEEELYSLNELSASSSYS